MKILRNTFSFFFHAYLISITFSHLYNIFKLVPVRTYDFQKTVIHACTQRNDEWGHKVKARIKFVHDLHAADAIYHKICSVNFQTLKQIPKKYISYDDTSPKYVKLSRPQDIDQTEAFIKVIDYL